VGFWNGIHFNRNLSRNPQIWGRYLAWWAYNNLQSWLPLAIPRSILRSWPDHVIQPLIKVNMGAWHRWLNLLKPLQRVVGRNAHRCDFTDPECGLLYGGDGEEMNRLFDGFLANIATTEDAERRTPEGTWLN
jgi:hypothetical protein